VKVITREQFQALEAVHGKGRILVVVAGAEGTAERVEFACRRLDAAEWAVFLGFKRKKDDASAENMLRRAVVGTDKESTAAEKAWLMTALNEDPQLGDWWGLQLLAAAGWQAELTEEKQDDGSYLLTAKVDGQEYSVTAKRLSRAQWQEYRRELGKGQDAAADVLAFRLGTGLEVENFDLVPALLGVFGDRISGLGTKGGAAPKSFTG
jgi:hypothetical protein